MLNIEQQISSIENANINKETFQAMTQAKDAMKKIHGGLTMDKVDQTMEDLKEQHAIGEEIAEALTQGNLQGVDEEELEDELAELQQEELDNKMLKTGSVPVSDQVTKLPSVNTGEGEFATSGGRVHDRWADVVIQWQIDINRLQKMMRRRSSRDCRPRWRCRAPYTQRVALWSGLPVGSVWALTSSVQFEGRYHRRGAATATNLFFMFTISKNHVTITPRRGPHGAR